jgi:hypothetical protein
VPMISGPKLKRETPKEKKDSRTRVSESAVTDHEFA